MRKRRCTEIRSLLTSEDVSDPELIWYITLPSKADLKIFYFFYKITKCYILSIYLSTGFYHDILFKNAHQETVYHHLFVLLYLVKSRVADPYSFRIRMQLNTDPDQMNTDPDPLTRLNPDPIRIRIRNTN